MTKTVCDICGKDMGSCPTFIKEEVTKEFRITSNGSIWDICPKCKDNLDLWIKQQRYLNGVEGE
jgi:hypothetical protein